GGIVARCAPTARVESRSAVGDPQQQEGLVLGGRQGVGVEGSRAEQNAGLDLRFLEVLLQRLDVAGSDRSLLPATSDEGAPLPPGAPHYAFELKEITPLGLGEHRVPMRAQCGNVEPDFAQLTRHQDLEVLGSELW